MNYYRNPCHERHKLMKYAWQMCIALQLESNNLVEFRDLGLISCFKIRMSLNGVGYDQFQDRARTCEMAP